MSPLVTLRRWAKAGENPLARAVWSAARAARAFELPLIRPLHATLYRAHTTVAGAAAHAARVLWWTPLFKSRLAAPAPGLFLYGGMPLLMGPLTLRFGRGCRVSGRTTITGRWAGTGAPEMTVGDNCDVGWLTTIAVGRRVVLGHNVRIAGRAFLAGYPGHPIDAADRAAGLPETADQVGDIVIEDDVWLATGVTVLAGVTIGRGTIVAAGSVVTKDLPPGVLAAGAPARVVRRLQAEPVRLVA
jgi:acetyltransferase-like isoleucine patch superfamily enzyme